MKKQMTVEEEIRMQERVREKLIEGIKKAEEVFGAGTAYILIECIIWDYETETFLDYLEDLNISDGHELALSNSGTNFADIVIALTGRGWQNKEVLYHIKGKAYEPTGRICKRCKARVWKSDKPGYSFQCFECGEDFNKFGTERETALAPIVEGAKEDGGLIGTGYCDEYCPHCEGETFNIPVGRISLCVHCGAELFPCAGCEQESGCQWNREDCGCQRFIHSPAWAKKEKKVSQ